MNSRVIVPIGRPSASVTSQHVPSTAVVNDRRTALDGSRRAPSQFRRAIQREPGSTAAVRARGAAGSVAQIVHVGTEAV